jgi:hypothetical protein
MTMYAVPTREKVGGDDTLQPATATLYILYSAKVTYKPLYSTEEVLYQ